MQKSSLQNKILEHSPSIVFPSGGVFYICRVQVGEVCRAQSVFVNGPSGPLRDVNLSTKMVRLLNHPPDSHVQPHFLSPKIGEHSCYF